MKTFCTLIIVFLALSAFSFSEAPKSKLQALDWTENGILIDITDHINIPQMNWPKTLIRYSIDFKSNVEVIKDLKLIDRKSKESIPFQLVKNKEEGNNYDLFFISDLPSGASRSFHLVNNSELSDQQALEHKVVCTSNENGILIDNGILRLKLPKKGEYRDCKSSLIKIGNNEKWLGYSSIPSQLKVSKLSVEEHLNSELFADYGIHIQFEAGKEIDLNLRLVAGMDFFEFEETMHGFSSEDSLAWNIIWDEFEPTNRYCPNRNSNPIDKKGKGYDNFRWEPIDGFEGDALATKHPDMTYDQNNRSDGRFPFKISQYHNWISWWRLPTAAFWDENSNQTIGVFIKDFEGWVNPKYPLWGSKEDLAIKFYKNEHLRWEFPLCEGKRSTAITIYPHQRDIDMANELNLPQTYTDYLFRWHSWISLDKTKNWILDYSSSKSEHPAFFTTDESETKINPKDLFYSLKRNIQSLSRATSRGQGPNPVGTRQYYERMAPMFELSEKQMSLDEYKQARAWFLFMTYIFMDETLMPVKNMLSGHPNFLADIKGVPGLAAFLFPDHPEAREMADHFEKSTALNLRYHTRPDVPSWEAKGGRWTENLSCYTWAFLKPTLKTSMLMHHFYDGKNRILQPNTSIYGNWLLNSLTSPLDKENGRRGYPPQGAHSRVVVPSNLFFTLGHELFYYDPLLAEKIFWASSPEDHGFENKKGRPDSWDNASKKILHHPGGTNPRLKSEKFTGYGFNLRSHFGEPGEMYVHLQQIDEGPNYRWGRAAKGGNGIIYYYAEGKQFSNNGIEDVGDDYFGDVEHCTNFGVKKEKSYRCIGDYRSVGKNDLTDPLYDFDFAQFASIKANSQAAPEYKSRSVLMSGNDYILIFDDVKDNSVEARLSWFVGNEDDFPFIHQLAPGIVATDVIIESDKKTHFKEGRDLSIKGKYFDGKGDFITLVTHRKEITPIKEDGAYKIEKQDGSSDWLFRYDTDKVYSKNQLYFEGTAGIIKQSADNQTYEAAIFQGHKIGIPELMVEILDNKIYSGISFRNTETGFSGIIQLREEGRIKFLPNVKTNNLVFYINGKKYPLEKVDESFVCNLPKGKHRWQWTSAGAIPDAPQIQSSVVGETECKIQWHPVDGAKSYVVQRSFDIGQNWINISETKKDQYNIQDLKPGVKIHVRVIAKGKGGLSEPSGDYPVYPGTELPHAPEGLRLISENGKIDLTWGQVLGADYYKLYQRKKGDIEYQLIYSGSDRSFSFNPENDSKIYEFVVTASNNNGESNKSIIADSDPNRFINWYPIPGEVFRRDTESHENGYYEYNHWIEQEMPVLKYPFQKEN